MPTSTLERPNDSPTDPNERSSIPKTAQDIRQREETPLDQVGARPIDNEEQAQLDQMERGFDNEAIEDLEKSFSDEDQNESDSEDEEPNEPNDSLNFNTDPEKKPKGNIRGKLKRLRKKSTLFAAGLAAVVTIILVISLFLTSLKLPHFFANISTYEFARLSRNFSDSVANVTEERIAADTEGAFGDSIRSKISTLRESTIGRFDKYRPQKVLDNMRADKQLGYVFESEPRLIKVPGLSDTKQVLKGIKINDNEIRFNTSDRSWYELLGKRSDRLEFNGRLTAQLESALQDSNTLVRGSVGKKIRSALGIKLQRWEKLTKAYKNGYEAEADAIKKTATVTNTQPSEKSIIAGINEAEQYANDLGNSCDQTCLENFAKNDGVDLAEKVEQKTLVTLNNTALTNAASNISSIYAIALPVCMIYDGSVERSGGTVDANSNRAIKTFNTFGSGADQQRSGVNPDGSSVDAEQIGGLADELKDITKSPSEIQSYGKTLDTSTYPNPEASNIKEFNIFSALPFVGGIAGNFFSKILQPVCPVITDPRVGLGVGVGELALTVLSGGESKVGEVAAEASAREIIGHMLSNIASKDSLKSFGVKITRDVSLIVGGTVLAKLIVHSRMGNMKAPIPNSEDLQVQAKQGGNMAARDLNRYQLYAAPMSHKDVILSNYQDYKDIAFKNSQKSIYDRYLNIREPNSMTNSMAISLTNISNKSLASITQGLISKLGSLFQSNGSILSVIMGTNQKQALAAATNTNFGIIQWGWTDEEIKLIKAKPEKYSPINNAAYVDSGTKFEDLKRDYDKCFTRTVGTLLANQDIERDQDGTIVADKPGNGDKGEGKGVCAPNNLSISNDEAFQFRIYMRNQNVYDHLNDIQNPSEASANAPAATGGVAGGAIDPTTLYQDSSSLACDPRTTDLGVQDGYHNEAVVKIKVCGLPNLKSTSDESLPGGITGANGQTIVNARVSGAFFDLVEAAQKEGRLTGGAKSSFRTNAHQQRLCDTDSSGLCQKGKYTYVGKPGTSNHQMGLAIDFVVAGIGNSHLNCINVSGKCTAQGHEDWEWLNTNSSKFKISQYVNEFWHFSPTGN
jgi:hypothetical protein